MPSETFYNLSEEKRERIINIAIREFAINGYRGSSVKKIADKAGVAKGSIYQYFQNKKELFHYIFEMALEKKIRYVNNLIIINSSLPFFQLLEKLFIDAAREAMREPRLYQLYSELLNGAGREIRVEISSRIEEAGKDYYRKILKKALEKGEIRTDISLELAVFVVYTFLRDFGELFGEQLESVAWEELQIQIRQMVEILKNGIARK